MYTIVNKDNYNEYLISQGISNQWIKRNFVFDVEKYIESPLQKVLLISGLRGTGKSVGILQSIKDRDAVYIIIEKSNLAVNPEEIINLLNRAKEHIICIDEYSWIDNEGRNILDAYLDTLTKQGKKVIITGTESLCIEALKGGELIHRTTTIQTNHMSFSEYCRIFNKEPNKNNCEKFLTEGGVFEDYVVNNADSMKSYIDNSIVNNLRAYVKSSSSLVDENKIGTLIYTVFYRAIRSIVDTKIKFYNLSQESIAALDRLNIDPDYTFVNPSEVDLVANILNQAGVIIKVPNFFQRENKLADYSLEQDYKTYIVNPAITYQFLKTIFADFEDSSLKGLLYEANCMVDMYYSKLPIDNIYFIESSLAENFEIDIAIVQNDDSLKKQIYLFECKLDPNVSTYNKNWSILNGKVEKAINEIYPDAEIKSKYIIHPGETSLQRDSANNPVIVTNQDDILYDYFKADKHIEKLSTVKTLKKKHKTL